MTSGRPARLQSVHPEPRVEGVVQHSGGCPFNQRLGSPGSWPIMAIESYATLEENNSVSTLTTPPTPTQRGRWATQHMKGKRGSGRRTSILNHLNYWPPHSSDNNRHSRRSGTDLGFIQEELDVEAAPEAEVEDRDNQGPRTIFFNIPLPPDAVDESGHPLKHYRRNKIRTAKYTPLSFIPRNLWYQFHNVANVYFLFLIILAVSCAPE